MIQFSCPSCAAVFSVGDEKAGKTGKCPKCEAKFVIPDAEPKAAPPAPPPPPADDDNVEIKPCPGCQAKLTVAKSDLGLDVECPYCKTVYKAAKAGAGSAVIDRPSKRSAPVEDDDDDRPRRRSRRDEDEDDDDRPSRRRNRYDDDDDDRPRKRRRDEDDYEDRPRRRSSRSSRSSAQATVNAPAMAMIILGIIGLLYGVLNIVVNMMGLGFQRNQFGGGGANNGAREVGMMVGSFFPLIWGTVVLLAGIKMRSLSSRISVLIGSIFAMLPCSPCCLLGIPFGIWSLVTISNPDVKRAFDS